MRLCWQLSGKTHKPCYFVTTQPLGSSFPRRRESSDSAEYNFRIELDSRLRENDGVQSKGLNSYAILRFH
jgi:hypothetical protein